MNKQIIKIISTLLLAVVLPAQAQYSKITYIHGDADGTPFAGTNQQGAVEWQINHFPYGDEFDNSGVDRKSDLSFAGKAYDEEIGLSYFGARWYDPAIGRFTSIDASPVDPNDYRTFNRYAYGNNNPYKYVDPDGNLPILIPLAIFIAKEIAAEGASRATGGVTDFLSVRRMGTKALRFGTKKFKSSAADQLAKNKAAGEAFEREVAGNLRKAQTDVVEQVTVKTNSGVKTRIDLLSRDNAGKINCTECKASATAPLTKNQKAAFPEIQKSGGIIVGQGKPGFPGGTKIPPTKVNIIRKKKR